MKDVKLKTIEQSDNVCLYSICFDGSEESEFERFLAAFKDNGKYNRDFSIILLALEKIIATSEDPAEAYEAARKLQSIPKNANPIRLHNRCKITGRPKGYMRQFGLSRIQFREMASNGLIPGVKKASW